jgi:hypothetical protein
MLQNKAMLVDLTIHQWTARKHDKGATREVERAHDASGAGRFNKQLVGKESLAAIAKKANEMRDFHYSKTLPWSDTGPRLLPAEMFMEYRQEINRLRGEFNLLVVDFAQNYPALVDEAKAKLKTLFSPSDYPPVAEIRSRFGVSLEITHVPTGADFRVDLADAERQEIQRDMEERMNARQQRATRECYVRVKEVLERMKKQCVEGKTKVTEALTTDAYEVALSLDKLNIMGDPELTRLGREMRESLLVGVDTLRNDPHTRKQVGDRAAEILNSVDWNEA